MTTVIKLNLQGPAGKPDGFQRVILGFHTGPCSNKGRLKCVVQYDKTMRQTLISRVVLTASYVLGPYTKKSYTDTV